MYVGMEGWQEWKGLGGWYEAEWRSTHTWWWALEPQFGLAAAAYITSIQALHIHHKSSTWAEMGKRNQSSSRKEHWSQNTINPNNEDLENIFIASLEDGF